MINDKELQNVSTLGAFDRYRYFIKKIADSAQIWLLKDIQGNYVLSEVEGNLLLSVWSAKEYIRSCLNGIWENKVETSLSLDLFGSELIPVIKEKNYLIDVFPVNNKTGFAVTLDEFIHDLNIELSNYE